MRLCVFSDIHGNVDALEAALPLMLSEKADAHVFLGDLCGYYYRQLEAYEIMRELPSLTAVLGNHDKMLLDIVDGDTELRRDYLARYGSSMERLLATEAGDMITWLRSLPSSHVFEDIGALCCHGSPADPLEGRIYPDADLEELDCTGFSFILLGHTHYRLTGESRGALVVNPGALGQPRDGRESSYAVLDTSLRSVTFRDVKWDRRSLMKDVRSTGDGGRYVEKILLRNGVVDG
jgi:putative phosphoesterase